MEEIASTIGIDCTPFKLTSGEVSVWDFGGQLEYSATHEFFLSTGVCTHNLNISMLTDYDR